MIAEVKSRYQGSIINYIDSLDRPTYLGHFGLNRISQLLDHSTAMKEDYILNEDGLISFKDKLFFLDSSIMHNDGQIIHCRRFDYEDKSINK